MLRVGNRFGETLVKIRVVIRVEVVCRFGVRRSWSSPTLTTTLTIMQL